MGGFDGGPPSGFQLGDPFFINPPLGHLLGDFPLGCGYELTFMGCEYEHRYHRLVAQ